jgi:EAL domain-containing protein (putative c-di-GMP-specific phosphodiesterase class I)
VAEGIKNEQQMAFLKERNCDELQGFLISRPLSPEKLADFLDEFGR